MNALPSVFYLGQQRLDVLNHRGHRPILRVGSLSRATLEVLGNATAALRIGRLVPRP